MAVASLRRIPWFRLLLLGLLLPRAAAGGQLRELHPLDDFILQEEMVPMRDGVRLYTLILIPKHAVEPLPILLERTPYNAAGAMGDRASTRLEVLRGLKYVGGNLIHAVQDIRGRYRSEGEYAMYRVPRGQFNRTETDETTDAWDTIDWLVRHVPSNGRVGIWGTSYPGWLTLAALRDPHPALAAAVPFNPVVDVWKADDWFHWGAFRASYAFEFIYSMETRKGASTPYPYEQRDLYTWMLGLGSVAEGLASRLDSRHEMWPRLMDNPAYGPYWQDCAADQWFTQPTRLVPTLHVHGWWDQEDIYGAPAAYLAMEAHDPDNQLNFFAAGPWYHGQHFADGSKLGTLSFDEDTAKRFRQEVLVPFLGRFLKGEEVSPPAQVTVFETGTNRWRNLEQWPPPAQVRPLYLQPDAGLGFDPPLGEGWTEFISDPAKPVPFTPRPFLGFDYRDPSIIAAWRRWMVEDQRFVDGRPDVATWVSPPLTAPITIQGSAQVRLVAETTGTDADWVVKLIDVFPDDDPAELRRSGFQLMVAGEIFRGRYRESLEEGRPVLPETPLVYTWPLPHANHTFQVGHRIMIQVQSTWFPLYDRNPQTFVDSIMAAPASAFRVQRHRIHHGRHHASALDLPVAP